MPLVTEIALKVILITLISIAYEQVTKEPLSETEQCSIIAEVSRTH